MIGGRWWCFSEEEDIIEIRIGMGRGRLGSMEFWGGFLISMIYVLLNFFL